MRNRKNITNKNTDGFKKIVRFNGTDYMMGSLNDMPAITQKKRTVTSDFFSKAEKSMITESFLNRLRGIQQKQEDRQKEQQANPVQPVQAETPLVKKDTGLDAAARQMIKKTSIDVMTVKNTAGEVIEFNTYASSKASIIFEMFETMVIFDSSVTQENHSKMEDFMYRAGGRNGTEAYTMPNISDIKFIDGTIKFVVSNRASNNRITIYYHGKNESGEKMLNIDIFYNGINLFGKMGSTTFRYGFYDMFRDRNYLSLSKREPKEYYSNVLREVMSEFKDLGVSVKLCKRIGEVTKDANEVTKETINSKFKIAAKYTSKEYQDLQPMMNAVDACIPNISDYLDATRGHNNYEGLGECDFFSDENYVMIGPDEKFYEALRKSFLMSDVYSSPLKDSNITHFIAVIQNQLTGERTKRDVYMLPVSLFTLLLPAFVIFLHHQ